METAIVIKNLSKKFLIGTNVQDSLRYTLGALLSRSKKEEIIALDNVSLEIKKGEVLGIIGKNGAGKSTLLKILSRITPPSSGSVELNGRVASLLEVGTGFHPELTGRENIYLNASLLGLSRKEINERLDDIIAFSGVQKFIETPVKKYSSGMYVRLAFSVAAHIDPDILLVDEVLSVGDYEFQKKCLGKMNSISESGRTVILVSHNLSLLGSLSSKIVTLKNGKLITHDSVDEGIASYIRENSISSKQYSGTIINNITFESKKSEVETILSGQPLKINFHHTPQIDTTNLILRFEIKNGSGDLMFLCNNRISGEQLADMANSKTISCTIKELPLMEGDYYLDFKLSSNGTLLEQNEESLEFKVINKNFYKTGLEPRLRKGVLVDYHFNQS